MKLETTEQPDSRSKSNSMSGCKRWALILSTIILCPFLVFFTQLFMRWTVFPWIESIIVRMHQDLVDKSFLTGQPCEAPCWYNLNLGVSTESDVRKTLARLPFVYQEDIREWNTTLSNDQVAKEIFYYCSYLNDKVCGRFLFSDGIVTLISTRIDFPLDFQTVVDKLGPADYYAMFSGIETQNCTINLFWLEDNLLITITNYQYYNCPYEKGIDPNSKVEFITYSHEEPPFLFEQYSDIYKQWQGFSKP